MSAVADSSGNDLGAPCCAEIARAKGVLFDLDGTLVDTLDSLWRAGNAVLDRMELGTRSRHSYRRAVGYGTTRMFETLLTEGNQEPSAALLEACTRAMVALYPEYWPRFALAFEGLAELVALLAQRGVRMGVVSNREQATVSAMLDRFFPAQRWQVVLGAGKFPNKPDPEGCSYAAQCLGMQPREVVLVGDTEVDILAARNAGMIAAAVSWGFRDGATLRAAAPSAIAESPWELAALFGLPNAARPTCQRDR